LICPCGQNLRNPQLPSHGRPVLTQTILDRLLAELGDTHCQIALRYLQDAGRALGASIAALGLSNKAVYDEDADGDDGQAEQPAGHRYPDGPDIAPESAPSVVSGAALCRFTSLQITPMAWLLCQGVLWHAGCTADRKSGKRLL